VWCPPRFSPKEKTVDDFLQSVSKLEKHFDRLPNPALCLMFRRCSRLVLTQPENDEAWAALSAIDSLFIQRLGPREAAKLVEILEHGTEV